MYRDGIFFYVRKFSLYLNSLTFLCQAILYISVLEGKAPWARGHPIFFLHFPKSEYFLDIWTRGGCVVGGTEFVIFIVGQTRGEYTGERNVE